MAAARLDDRDALCGALGLPPAARAAPPGRARYIDMPRLVEHLEAEAFLNAPASR